MGAIEPAFGVPTLYLYGIDCAKSRLDAPVAKFDMNASRALVEAR
jgi:hypothetical protein